MSDSSATPPRNAPPKAGSERNGAPPLSLPLRFVWQSDEFGNISGVSPELLAAMGADRISDGQTWDDLIHERKLDPSGTLAQALARRDTWSGVTVNWPIAGGFVLNLELAGLPVFDRDHTFRGFRGFGVVREPPVALDVVAVVTSEPEAPPEAIQDVSSPILPFRRPGLNADEDNAFREIARTLQARMNPNRDAVPNISDLLPPASDTGALYVLEALPAAILIHRLGTPLFANHAFLDLTGFEDLGELILHGLDALFEEVPRHSGSRGLGIRTLQGRSIRVEGHLKTITWEGEPASLMFLGEATTLPALHENPRERELRTIVDIAADGVVVFDGNARIVSVNRGAELLFGYEAAELEGRSFTLLLQADSHRPALEYLEALKAGNAGSIAGREVTGMKRRGGTLPLFIAFGRIDGGADPRFCAVLRDISHYKQADDELRAAKSQAEKASAQKSDFLARVSHEIRTPVSAILGFADIMKEERFGPIGSDRYKQYLADIHQSGTHVISLVNDLLDLAKIEAGRLELNFVRVDLNEAVASAVALLQPQANSNRIIIRTSLAPALPPVIVDQRSLKQIVLNLLSNAVKYTPAGGQVIVSSVLTELGQAVLRVRDTGPGMNEREIAIALEPFRQLSSENSTGGTGLGLPLTKALVEANQARFTIQSAAGAGTLVEVLFPPERVLGG